MRLWLWSVVAAQSCFRSRNGSSSRVLGELLFKEFGRLDIQGVWTEQRFPLSNYEVSGSWSYRLAGEAATISVVWVQKWRLGGGLWAAGVTPNHWLSSALKSTKFSALLLRRL
ncbi:hypothetical protein F2Q68_00033772 [Brassica cretica]|uniref:Uncharacterized protein n=1 Tax=Brassica cretica TaxID=69181 RepID=A0A8S9H1U8_BRACR|nr:hypothetical protein F2Q68_00033772 [Brassica cretica]